MSYKIYDYDDVTGEIFRCTAPDIDSMFPDRDDPERLEVERELSDHGRCWVGGGASPLVLIVAI